MTERYSTDSEDTDLRLLVDIVWQHATESTAVPFHKTSDMLIAKYRQCLKVEKAKMKTTRQKAAVVADTIKICEELVRMAAFVENKKIQQKIYRAVRQLQLLDQLAQTGNKRYPREEDDENNEEGA